MRDKILSILFFGTLFWLAFVFLFYAGLFVNYIEHHGIPIFYNQFFADSQAWWLWPFGIVIFGTLFMLEGKIKEKVAFFLVALLLAALSWFPSLGESIGRTLFAKPHVSYRFNHVVVRDATVLYSGRGYDYVVVPGKKMTLRYPTNKRIER